MKKKLIFLLLILSMAFSASSLLGSGTVFNKENMYNSQGYWVGCPNSGTTCAHFPPKK